jgi:hypothetical protein
MNDKKRIGLGQSLLDTLHNSELSNVTVDLTEVALDSLLEEGILKEIPIVSTIVGLGKSAIAVRDYLLIRKIIIFLHGVRDIPKEKVRGFVNDIEQDPKYAENVGSSIILLLDRYDHIDKANLMAKIFCANINGEISYDEFLILSTSIDRAFIQDLEVMLDHYAGKFSYREISSTRRNLFNCNFTDFYVLNEDQQNSSGLEYPWIYHLNKKAEKFARIVLGNRFCEERKK